MASLKHSALFPTIHRARFLGRTLRPGAHKVLEPPASAPGQAPFLPASLSPSAPFRRRVTTAATLSPSSSLVSTARPSSVIRRIQKELESGARTAESISKEYLERVQSTDDALHSFLHCDPERVLEQARQVDALLASQGRPQPLPPLAGIPIAVKDNIVTSDMPSTAGSRILEGYRAPYDATAVRRLREQQGVVLGKTNMDEFGMGSTSEQSAFQVTRNPWASDRVPGGSSGGSAAAVAAGQCAVALGSDTGGSVRQPASFCGVVGLKPTYGRVSRFGLVAYASSLDVVGCLTSCVEDAALVLQALAGHDPADSTSSPKPPSCYTHSIQPPTEWRDRPLEGVRLGVVGETMGAGVDPAVVHSVASAVAHFESLGATINQVSLPSFALGLPAYYILAASEASSNLSRYDGLRFGFRASAEDLTELYTDSRGRGFGAEVKRRILMGTYALSAGFYDAYYRRAQQIRSLVLSDFTKALSDNDALITPTAPTPAYRIGEKMADPLAMYAGDLMTVNVNLAGLPAISIPCALTPTGSPSTLLPVGMQLIGRAFSEAQLLKYAHVYEQSASFWQ